MIETCRTGLTEDPSLLCVKLRAHKGDHSFVSVEDFLRGEYSQVTHAPNRSHRLLGWKMRRRHPVFNDEQVHARSAVLRRQLMKEADEGTDKKTQGKNCPTPSKHKYHSRKKALAWAGKTVLHSNNPEKRPRARVYICPCGMFHITSKK